MNGVVWEPDAATLERSNVIRLMRRHGIETYRELVRRSIDDPEWFWPAAIEDIGVEFSTPWERVVDVSRGPEWATWFVGGKLNVAWNCVHRWAGGPRADEEAVVGLGEDGERRSLTYAELSREVVRLAGGLLRLGVEPGDRVAIFLPMAPEVAIASHACAHIGAVQVPIFSGFAAPAVAQRLVDSGAKVAITTETSRRRGREVPMLAILGEARRDAPELEHVVVAPWDDLRTGGGDPEPVAVDSEHPYILTYTSGTTGRPKGVVHVQGGFLASIAREAAYQGDIQADDVVHFATDMGWIMGPWTLVGGGVTGAKVVLAEGAPDWPPDRLWRMVESEGVTILGCSPTLVRGLIPHGAPTADLSSLRLMITTGEAWNPDPYLWLHQQVGGGRCPIINISGGTEVGACFLSPSVAMPIKACSLGFQALGMAVDVVDDEGRSLAGSGEVGELVCRKPFPGMTRGFWRDRDRYLDTYWRRFPGIWTHGDWASVDEDGYWFLHGRSDDTLNIAGKRIGPAELESAVVAHPDVAEAAAVAIPHEVKGDVPWVFCVLVPGREGDAALAEELRGLVAGELGKPFTPERVVFVPELPKTRSAKIVRRAVRATALGQDPGDMSSVENPEALEEIAAVL